MKHISVSYNHLVIGLTVAFVFFLFVAIGFFNATSTDIRSFASQGQGAGFARFCERLHATPEKCDELYARYGDSPLHSWCTSQCHGGGLEKKTCVNVCISVNLGATCSAQCGKISNPGGKARCTAECPDFINETVATQSGLPKTTSKQSQSDVFESLMNRLKK